MKISIHIGVIHIGKNFFNFILNYAKKKIFKNMISSREKFKNPKFCFTSKGKKRLKVIAILYIRKPAVRIEGGGVK